MPAWHRAEAYFGINGLRLVKADFNAATARITVSRLGQGDVNPCFQALLCARRLLPRVQAFEVYTEGIAQPVIAIDGRALDYTLPVWNQAIATFDRMPFSAFLPANLAARIVLEPENSAVRAVAWIAADDVLDALDGGPDSWDPTAIILLEHRVALVDLALVQCLAVAPAGTRARLSAIHVAVRDLRSELTRSGERPFGRERLDHLAPTMRIRHFWSVWGPVHRLPNLQDSPTDQESVERQPGHRAQADYLHWQTL